MPRGKRVNFTDDFVRTTKPRAKKFDLLDKLDGFVLRVQPSGTKTYFARFWNGSRVRWHKIGDASVFSSQDARKEAIKILADAARGIDATEIKRDKRKADQDALTLGKFAEGDYAKNWLSQRRSGAATLARLKACFSEFWNMRLDAITQGLIEKWRSKRIAEGRTAATVNRDLVALKACLSKALDWGIISAHPLTRLKPLRVDSAPKVRYLLPDEETRLLAALDAREERLRKERDSANKWRRDRGYEEYPDLRKLAFADFLKPLILLSLHTGLRRGEAFSLEWTDTDLERGMLTVQGKTAKSGKTRHIPLNSFLRQVLTDWKAQSTGTGLLFSSPVTGGRLDNCNSSWEEVLSEAKVDGFRWHDMRHHFASKLVMAGVDLNTVRDLLGHASIVMTLRYSHLCPEVRAAAVERLVVPEGKIVPFKKRGKR